MALICCGVQVCALLCSCTLILQIEPGLGLSETFYHWTISTYSVGQFLGSICAGFIVSRISFWYITLLALLTNITAYVFYATAISGWIMIIARLLAGLFGGSHNVISYTYFGVSYPVYLEALGKEQRVKEEQKTTKVKDKLFTLYAVAANLGILFGPGLLSNKA